MAINNDILNNVDNIGSIGTQLDLFDNSVFIPVGKLDADQYAVDDIDGVTESLFGSGNMNFLSLQAAQTNEYLASLAGSSDQPSFNDTDAPAFFQNASILEGAATSLGIQTPSSTRGSYFSNGEDSSLDAGRPLGGENHESHAYAGNADAGPDVTSTAKASASSFYNPTPLLNDTLGADNGLNGNNGGSGTVQIVTTGLNGNDGSNGSDGQDGGGGGGGDTLIDIDIDLGDTLGDVINNTVNEVSDLLTTIVNNAGDIVTNVTDILGDTINNVTDILTTIINGVLGDDGLHIGLNLDVIDTVLGNLSLDIGDTISGALNAGLDLAPLTDVLNNLTDLGLPILADLDLGLNFDIDPSNIMLNLGDINDLGSLIDTVDDLLNPYINLDVADTSEVTDVVSGVLDNLGLGDNSLLDAVIQLANDALDPVDSIVNTVEDLVQDPLATVSGLLDDPQGTFDGSGGRHNRKSG
ncbi:MAG: hypothetical protein LRY39_01640 [Alphaproteobacteria bacterium]|nr:hypothetical protein [Alphaproteobacteria bacterium]